MHITELKQETEALRGRVGEDATEQTQAAMRLLGGAVYGMETLHHSEERLRTLMNSVPQLIWSNTGDGVADFFNRGWYDYTGLSFEESYGLGWEAVVHPDDAPRSKSEWARTLAEGKIFDCEYRLRGSDGNYRWFIGRNVPVEEGPVIGWFGSATDIQELKQAQFDLQEADRRKNHFLAILGHELRNPLTAIRDGVAILLSPRAGQESRDVALPVVADQVEHMGRLVDDLLDLTRVVQGSVQVRRKKMAVQEALQHALEMVRLPTGPDFAIDVQIPAEPLEILGDRVRLTQVFMNVLSNAVKYSGDSRRIEVSAAREGEFAVVRFRDWGLGMAPELLPRIFEPFVQATPGLTLQAGLGLGLAVVRQLVRLHDGRVEAFSEGEGRGSEFLFHFPLLGSPP
jgi:PAS domain S-box-containing protein